MFGARLDTSTFVRKPRVLLGEDFPFIKGLSVGDKGQMDAVLEIVRVFMDEDENGDEVLSYEVKILKAENIEETMRRV